jgi:hypothetical protein
MRRLSLPTAVALAQVVSAFVMVFTLLYAVSEWWVRTCAVTNTELEWILYGRLLEMDVLLAESEDLADIVLRAGSDPVSLTPPERARYLAYEHIFYDSWNAAYDARQSGLIGAKAVRVMGSIFHRQCRSPTRIRMDRQPAILQPPFHPVR